MTNQFFTNGVDLWVLHGDGAKFWTGAEWIPKRGSVRMKQTVLADSKVRIVPLEEVPSVLAKLRATMPFERLLPPPQDDGL